MIYCTMGKCISFAIKWNFGIFLRKIFTIWLQNAQFVVNCSLNNLNIIKIKLFNFCNVYGNVIDIINTSEL